MWGGGERQCSELKVNQLDSTRDTRSTLSLAFSPATLGRTNWCAVERELFDSTVRRQITWARGV